ncbi:hypothetical protein HUN01_34550 [Nostoc edaphicum CCNP1411]|uniref:Uncharacterized protein n=1 Tax=Nostoc edaphicum CCNP1411 TaxID=1472755 RepID=A0A7D7RAG6_9NOSO|nr:hypothetical protein [Nostoc edaphicum]QMS92466.1 hypothetical protein HUN01_34550 [Nostoc edaphicum CCNP1411]
MPITVLFDLTHHLQCLEEGFRSQNGLNAPLPLTGVRINQSGIQTCDFLVDHQIYDLVGVQKRRLFRRDARILVNAALSASRTENIAEF